MTPAERRRESRDLENLRVISVVQIESDEDDIGFDRQPGLHQNRELALEVDRSHAGIDDSNVSAVESGVPRLAQGALDEGGVGLVRFDVVTQRDAVAKHEDSIVSITFLADLFVAVPERIRRELDVRPREVMARDRAAHPGPQTASRWGVNIKARVGHASRVDAPIL